MQEDAVLKGQENACPGLKRVQWGFRCAIAACALIDCWIARYSMNPDGVSYLDMGDLYWQRNWGAALNSYWSPFYGWILGLLLKLTKPSMRWEYPEVHLLNLAIFLAMLCSFEFFWREVLAARTGEAWTGTSRKHAWGVGYLLFACMHLSVSGLAGVNPDQIVAALVYIVFGLLLKFSAGRMSVSSAGLLGAALGIGYLTKAAMLPFGVIVVAVLIAMSWKSRAGLWQATAAITCFLALSAPFIAALSWKSHQLNYGDAGKLNIAWSVNGVKPIFRHWQGDTKGSARPPHTTRKIMSQPEIYEFADPVAGTYPVWYAPAYWYQGADTHMHPDREAAALFTNLKLISAYTIRELGILTAVMLTIFLFGGRLKESWQQLLRYWAILLPSLAVFLMYAMVTWEPRYTSAFMLALFGAIFASSSIVEKNGRVAVFQIACLFVGLMVGALLLKDIMVSQRKTRNSEQQIEFAEQLRTMGIGSGSRVALLGDGFDESSWARLDRVKIVAEVPRDFDGGNSTALFWSSTLDVEKAVLDKLKGAGAQVVVAAVPNRDLPSGWLRVRDTGKVVYLLQ